MIYQPFEKNINYFILLITMNEERITIKTWLSAKAQPGRLWFKLEAYMADMPIN